MRIFSMADTHLSLSVKDKAMDVFGKRWENHIEKIRERWSDTVSDGDIVLINGDVSWAMHFSDARQDLFFLHSLPGLKVLSKGNHDYWWDGYQKLLRALPPSITAVQNNTITVRGVQIAGTRLWNLPGSSVFKEEEDRKIYEREKLRLSLSLSGLKEDAPAFVMLHFPPFMENACESEITGILEQSPAKHCVYGHLHGAAASGAFEGTRNGITYTLTAADHLGFVPKLITIL